MELSAAEMSSVRAFSLVAGGPQDVPASTQGEGQLKRLAAQPSVSNDHTVVPFGVRAVMKFAA
jgi:hypothetical protein